LKFFRDLFNDSISNSDYLATNKVNRNGREKSGRGIVRGRSTVPEFTGGKDKNYENPPITDFRAHT